MRILKKYQYKIKSGLNLKDKIARLKKRPNWTTTTNITKLNTKNWSCHVTWYWLDSHC